MLNGYLLSLLIFKEVRAPGSCFALRLCLISSLTVGSSARRQRRSELAFRSLQVVRVSSVFVGRICILHVFLYNFCGPQAQALQAAVFAGAGWVLAARLTYQVPREGGWKGSPGEEQHQRGETGTDGAAVGSVCSETIMRYVLKC